MTDKDSAEYTYREAAATALKRHEDARWLRVPDRLATKALVNAYKDGWQAAAHNLVDEFRTRADNIARLPKQVLNERAHYEVWCSYGPNISEHPICYDGDERAAYEEAKAEVDRLTEKYPEGIHGAHDWIVVKVSLRAERA